ncbi:HU family DNA-binding protein [Microvirga sp. GCM10011540]|uniref:HU family DNA-binding protein n=1 Tax=Microvirga sp. GCM10011540 TaxID=3317338 RepID=UPI00361A90B9
MAKSATKTTTKTASARKAATTKSAASKAAAVAKKPVKAASAKSATKAAPKAAAKSAKASAAAASPILTLRNIAERLSEAHELPKRQANEMLTQMVEMITKSLKKGEKIRLAGLGILQVRKRAARTGRNPQTGEPIKIKASKKIAFRPAKELKEAI